MFKKALLISMSAAIALAGTNADDDKVTTLPQMTFDKEDLYSGYLPVTSSATRSLHYLYVTSQNDPETDPVIVWFNGGPGCSSVLGWAQEHGPWVMEDGTDFFVRNDYSWNTFANVLYIESPGGVGYSLCNFDDEADCTYTDDSSAADNFDAIMYFFETLFPERQTNEIYISGESYAGIYVPFVFDLLAQEKENPTKDFTINLQGYMVGNGCTNWKHDNLGKYMLMAYWHGLIDDALYNKLNDNDCMD